MVVSLRISTGSVAMHEWGPSDGSPVLCVHGLSAHGLAFADLADRLVEDGRRVIAVDLRGRGRSEITPAGTYGLEAHARDVELVADALELPRFAYVGWSMGALIGLLLARRAASRLTSMTLLDHAGRMDPAALEAVRAGLARLDVVVPSREVYVDAVRRLSPIQHWTESWARFYEYELGRTADGQWSPTTDAAACLEDLAEADAHDWAAGWAALTMPSLLVRCSVGLDGGLVVPSDVRDDFLRTALQSRAIDVAVNHFDIMTAPRALDAVAEHVARI